MIELGVAARVPSFVEQNDTGEVLVLEILCDHDMDLWRECWAHGGLFLLSVRLG